jgi:two-component system chemotaxis response regulator CheY
MTAVAATARRAESLEIMMWVDEAAFVPAPTTWHLWERPVTFAVNLRGIFRTVQKFRDDDVRQRRERPKHASRSQSLRSRALAYRVLYRHVMTHDQHRPCILVAEDDPSSRAALAELLAELGYEVKTARDGLEGLEWALQSSLDLVITDLQMPRLDGLALIQRLRELPAHMDVPLILLSGLNDPLQRAGALDRGADDFLTKPVEIDELLARVRLHLRHGSRSRELQLRAVFDELTGVLNRRGTHETLEREVHRSERNKAALSVLLIDLDGFKAINDSRGHAAGDRVLKHVGRKLTLELRAHDRVGRWGGDEFLIILPDTDRVAAGCLAGRLRSALLPIQISIGAADARPGDSVESLVARADSAMYADKAARTTPGTPLAEASRRSRA